MAGFKVIVNSSVSLANTMDQAAALVARAYLNDHTSVRVRVRTTLTRDRDLRADEQLDLVRRTATLIYLKETA